MNLINFKWSKIKGTQYCTRALIAKLIKLFTIQMYLYGLRLVEIDGGDGDWRL